MKLEWFMVNGSPKVSVFKHGSDKRRTVVASPMVELSDVSTDATEQDECGCT